MSVCRKVKTALSTIFRRTKETEKDVKRKIVVEEIKDIQKKRRFLTAAIENLIKDVDKYILDGAKKKGFQLLEWVKWIRWNGV